MAIRAQPIDPVARAGGGALALIAALFLGALLAVAVRAEGGASLAPSDWAAIRFTVVQAALSAILSVLCAIPVAQALARRRFPGRSTLIALMGAPFILPVIVAVLGLIMIYGRGGVVNAGLGALGLSPLNIFGLPGVVLAHVFLNMPLAVRLLLAGWQRIPAERLRLASAVGFAPADITRHFHLPMLKEVLPGALAVIFLICTTSFAVALILGGGPRATTVELAIYQAFRFEFDLGRAALLGLIQVAICLVAGFVVFRLSLLRTLGAGLDRPMGAWPGLGRWAAIGDTVALVLAAGFLLSPLLAVVLRGLPAIPELSGGVWGAAGRSVLLALLSAGLALGLALCVSAAAQRARIRPAAEGVAFLSIAVSPLVLGTGLFVILRPWVSPDALALPVTGLINALVALPFLLRGLMPALSAAEATQGLLAHSLGMSAWARWRYAILPRLARPMGFGMGLAAALSMGDLGVIALFSVTDTATLPLEMYRLRGAYRTDEAEGAAVVLLGLSLGLFWVFDRLGRRCAAT